MRKIKKDFKSKGEVLVFDKKDKLLYKATFESNDHILFRKL